jgi:hypothetical protein
MMEPKAFTVGIASLCSSSWTDMHGDEKHRFCHQCSQFVHNPENLDEEEKLDLIRMAQTRDGRCPTIYTRHDGTVLPRDCPVGAEFRMSAPKGKTAQALIVLGIVVAGCLTACNFMRVMIIEQLAPGSDQSFRYHSQ